MNLNERRRRWKGLVELVNMLPVDAGLVSLNREVSLQDGFPSRGESAGGRGSGQSSSVEATVIRRMLKGDRPDQSMIAHQELVDRALQSIAAELARLGPVIERYAPAPESPQLCTVASYHEPWAVPRAGESFPCTEQIECYPTGTPRAEMLCVKHRKRCDRARRAAERESVA